MADNTERAARMIQRARVQLTLDKRLVFFASLVLKLKVRANPNVNTACVNNVAMQYNTDFIVGLSQPQVLTLVAHETLHPALGHPWRRGNRDHRLFNAAADYAINWILQEHDFAPLDGWLCDRKYAGMSAERIYDMLEDESDDEKEQQKERAEASAGTVEEPQQPDSADSDSTDGDDDSDNGTGGTGGEGGENTEPGLKDALESSEGSEEDWKAAMAEAGEAARRAGTLTSSIDRMVERSISTKVNWKAELQQFIQQTARNDYTWYRPSSRYLPRGLFMPSLQSEQMPPIVFVIDTSGSVSNRELGAYEAEINSAISSVNPEHVTVIYCDTRVRCADRFEAGEQVRLTPKGGGGTDFRPPFDWVRDVYMDERPAALVYFTDLGCNRFPEEADVEYPTMWLTTERGRTAPFGTTIPMEV